jgi:hypothetical protein
VSSYADEVKAAALALGSDGCSHVPELYQHCCYEHDIHCRTHRTLRGVPISSAEAAERFRHCIQVHSSFRWLSPLSWWRWAGVRTFGPQFRKDR